MNETTSKFIVVVGFVAAFTLGCFIQMTFDAKQDCNRFNDAAACDYVKAHPVLSAWFGR